MVAIEKLCCVRLGVSDLKKTAEFATNIIGLQSVPVTPGMALFRSDFRDHTLALYESQRPEQSLCVEVRSPAVLETAIARLREAGYDVKNGDAVDCQLRRVKAFASFRVRTGVRIEIVVRPLHSGWRYFPSRDSGIVEFFGVAFASTDVEADIRLWTEIFNGRLTDYVGDCAYIAIDDEHHRIAIHPSHTDRLLEMQFRLESIHELMQNNYFLQSVQVGIAHGPGRRPTSQQVFLSFRGPDEVLFGFVTEGQTVPRELDWVPRQFPRTAGSFCSWGSVSDVPEFSVADGQR